MAHVFIETNWLFAYAAPAHHQVAAAAKLLERARQGEFTLHLPNICIGEARQAILTKCQPRNEVNAIRRFLSWAVAAKQVEGNDADAMRLVLDKFESRIKKELNDLDQTFQTLAGLSCVKIFALDDQMLGRATELALAGIALKPFDHAVLAGVLVGAERLWIAGERAIAFCEADSDLQPWDRHGQREASAQGRLRSGTRLGVWRFYSHEAAAAGRL